MIPLLPHQAKTFTNDKTPGALGSGGFGRPILSAKSEATSRARLSAAER